MAMTATLSQRLPAIFGQDTDFVLTVSNSGASAVNVTSIQPIVTTAAGGPAPGCNISGPYAAPGVATAQVFGSQFNVQVGASASVAFVFSVQFFGPAIGGVPSTPLSQFTVGATCAASDASVFGPVPLNLVLNRPNFGAGSSPPNPAVSPGQLNYSGAVNSALAL